MGRIFEGFEILCNDYEYILGKKGGLYLRKDPLKERRLFKEIWYLIIASAIMPLNGLNFI